MTILRDTLARVTSDLRGLGYEFAVVGGLAVSVRTEPRLTRDIDLAVAVADDRAGEECVFRLQQLGYRVEASIEQTATGRLGTVRLSSPDPAESIVDLLFASSGIEREVAAGAERIEVLPGVLVPVASVGHLIAMKLLARDDRRRPTDADDLQRLADVAQDEDWRVAHAGVELIVACGASRERDLVGALSALRRHGAW